MRLADTLIRKLGQAPNACWLFCSPAPGMAEMLAGIHEALGTPNIVGCTSDGEISSDGLSSGSVVLGGIASDQVEFTTAVARGLRRRQAAAGADLAAQLAPGTRYVQMFSDGLTGDGCALLAGMASELGDQVLTDAAVAIGFSGDFYLGTGIRSGWTPIGLPKKVTRATGNTLYELNGEPALRVFERFLGRHAAKLPSIGVEYPLGLLGQWGDVGEQDYFLLRATMSVNREDGSITFAGEVPEGAMVSLTCAAVPRR